jgi:hypothetical protein
MRPVTLWLLLVVLSAATLVSADDWIAREKIRAGWIYHHNGPDKLAFFKQYGLNTLLIHAGNREHFSLWAKEAKTAGMRLFGVVGASYEVGQTGMRPCVFGNGYQAVIPCPLEERYWSEVLTKLAVTVAREGQEADKSIAGILIDWEMYANSNKGGQIYFTDACYCDHCFGGFLQAKGRENVCAQVAFKERVAWLKAQELFDAYHPHLQQQVRAQANRLREAVAAVDPEFFVGFYPVPHNWHLVGVAQGLGTPQHPMILWATSTYGGGGPSRVPDDWQQEMQKQEIHCYYAAGMLLRMYTAANLAKNLFEVSRKGHGYWLFTVHTLCIPEEQQRGDYHLCAGSPAEYLEAIQLANSELDKLAGDREYLTPLEFVEEPVRYRHPGFDIGRFEPPALEAAATAPRGEPLEVPPLGLIATSYLLMHLQAGEKPSLVFDVYKPKSGDVWGVSYAVLDPEKKSLTQGRMTPGEEFALTFEARQAGLHTVVVTPGYYGRCQVLTTTVPYAHWTWKPYPAYEIAGPGGTVYFHVPAGLTDFTLDIACQWATAQVQITVRDPQGKVVVDQPTDEYVRNARLTVPTGGQGGQVWSLQLSRIEGKSYRSAQVLFDPKLPPAVSLRPDFVLRSPAAP